MITIIRNLRWREWTFLAGTILLFLLLAHAGSFAEVGYLLVALSVCLLVPFWARALTFRRTLDKWATDDGHVKAWEALPEGTKMAFYFGFWAVSFLGAVVLAASILG